LKKKEVRFLCLEAVYEFGNLLLEHLKFQRAQVPLFLVFASQPRGNLEDKYAVMSTLAVD